MKRQNMITAFELFGGFEVRLRMAHTDAVEVKDGFAEILIYSLLLEASKTHWTLQRMAEAAKGTVGGAGK